MFFVKYKRDASFGNRDLNGCWGSGQLFGQEWAGVVYLDIPFDRSKLQKTGTDLLDTRGGVVPIKVTVNLDGTFEESPASPGGHLHADGQRVSLWYRCTLKAGQFELM
jgi:hypothetical protein